jgi:DNA-binding beta-propeller fold protein YncE
MRSSAWLAAALAAISMTLSPAYAAPGAGVLLVGNKGENTVSFVDLGSGEELARKPTGNNPHEIAISPDGTKAAVVAYGGKSIDIFDIASRERQKTIDLGPNQGPHGIVWLADGRIVATTERSRSVAIVDPAKGELIASIPTDQEGTHMVAATRDGTRAYTANIGGGTVTVIDLERGAKIADHDIGGRPEGIALSLDEQVLWVADLDGARVQAFDRRSFEKLAQVETGPVPIRVAASPDGRWIVTSNLGNGSITMIDSVSLKKVRDVAVSGAREAGQVTILFGPDGKLYGAETGRNTVAEIDLESGKVLRRLPAGAQGDGLAIAP